MSTPQAKLYGVDISHANAEVDLHALVTAGNLTFIGLKATEGVNFIDPSFFDRLARITKYLPSIYVIAYHFLRIDSSSSDQMHHFNDVLAHVGYFGNPRSLAPAVDSERGLNGEEPTATNTGSAIGALRSLTGHRVGGYSGLDYWKTHLSTVTPDYKWVARYSTTPPSIAYDIWQDSETKVLAGHAYDHNIVNMTEAEFVTKCGR